ncbi:MAG TPA: dephospho-CoA kinase, partial [Bacteroidia bacterium]|nr:dephospho-CoA kinase [Bacteroidia bacterium]
MKVGITGGIGSGKSIVTRIFKSLEIPVYNADDAAKRLMNTNPILRSNLQKLFGEEIFPQEGQFDRKKLAAIVFHQPELLQKLNNLVHPAVGIDYQEWQQKQKAPYTIREAAILYESGTHVDLDAVIMVDAPENLRIERIKERDSRTENEIKAIIQQQWSSEELRARANFIIDNDDTHPVIP